MYSEDDTEGAALYEVMSEERALRWTLITGSNSRNGTGFVFGRVGDRLLGNCDVDGDGSADLIALTKRSRLRVYGEASQRIKKRRLGGLRRIVALSCGDFWKVGRDQLAAVTECVPKGRVGSRGCRATGQQLSLYDLVSQRVKRKRVQRIVGLTALDLDSDGVSDLATVRAMEGGRSSLSVSLSSGEVRESVHAHIHSIGSGRIMKGSYTQPIAIFKTNSGLWAWDSFGGEPVQLLSDRDLEQAQVLAAIPWSEPIGVESGHERPKSRAD
jgi:hypothetical protein